MTDDTRSRWENWQLYRREWSRHPWAANNQRRRTAVVLPPPGLALTVLSTWPQSVQIVASGLLVGQVVTITRTPAGSTTATAVRGANGVTMTAGTLLKVDAEAPFGTLLTYRLTVDGIVTAIATVTLALTGGKVALTDAISGDSAEVVVLAWPEKKWDRNSSVFAVAGRNIVVTGQASGFTGTIDLFVETDDAKQNVFSLFQAATSGIVQIRQDGTYDGVDAYLSALSYSEQRYSQDGSDERRILSLDVVETGAWAPTLESPGFTLDDIKAAYVGLTYTDLAAAYSTLLDLALGSFS